MARVWMLIFSISVALLTLAGFGQKQTPPAQKQEATLSYTVVDLGTLGGKDSDGSALNNKGQVVGQAYTATGSKQAFLWSDGKMHNLGTLPGFPNSNALGINDAGQIIGSAENAGQVVHQRGCLWQNRRIMEIGVLPGDKYSSADAINEKGQIAATSYKFVDVSATDPLGMRMTLFLWEKGKRTPLSVVPAHSYAASINASGDVLGVSGHGGGTAFVYRKGKILDLGTLGGKKSEGNQIDDKGNVVGMAETAQGEHHAFLWENGKMRDLGSPGPGLCSAHAINSKGQVVGSWWPKGKSYKDKRALLWENGKMVDLNDHVAPGTKWILTSANAINDKGLILCSGRQGEQTHALLLIPKK